MHRFQATLKGFDIKGTTRFIEVPKRVMAAFAPRVRVPIRGTLNGYAFRTTVADMGFGACFGVNATMRTGAGIKRNDRVAVALERDDAKRTVSVPKDLRKAMSATERERFGRLSYTHRKEYIQAITNAKRPETRRRRIEQTVQAIRALLRRH